MSEVSCCQNGVVTLSNDPLFTRNLFFRGWVFGLAMPILELVFQVPAPELQIQFLFYYTQLLCPKMQPTLLYEISFFILQGYGIKVILQSSYLVKLPDCIQCYYDILTHKLTFQKRVTLTNMIQMETNCFLEAV